MMMIAEATEAIKNAFDLFVKKNLQTNLAADDTRQKLAVELANVLCDVPCRTTTDEK